MASKRKPSKRMSARAKAAWERESERISKQRAARFRRQQFSRRCMALFASVAMLYATGAGWYMWYTGTMNQQVDKVVDGFYGFTARTGFSLKNIYLEGRHTTPMPIIQHALDLQYGDPILATSVDEVKERLESLPEVKHALVERALPDTLHVEIIERQPVAVWQYKNALHLIDSEGVVMTDARREKKELLLIVGEDAPAHMPELMEILGAEPVLYSQVDSAIRVGERRWNIRMKNGVEVKLPEVAPGAAWHQLAIMEKEQKVLARAIKAIDLRFGDRIFIKLSPDAQKPEIPTAGAKET